MNANSPHQYGIGVRWTGGKSGALSAPPRPELAGGPPPQFGGTDAVWSPEHLLLGSTGLCLMLTFLAIAERAKLELSLYDCAVEGALDKTEAGLVFTRIVVRVKLRASDQAQAEALLQKAKKHCIVSNSLKASVVVETVPA